MTNIERPARVRLDIALLSMYPDFSRAFLQKLCSQDKVLVDGVPQKGGYRLKGSEDIQVLHDMSAITVVPDIDIPILYEDANVMVVDKPAGVLSHGLSKFLGEPSVASFLRQRLVANKQGDWAPEDLRFGIVHRLDRVTSGVMICAKNQSTMRWLQNQFAVRKAQKTYLAVAHGIPKLSEAKLDLPIERNPKVPSIFKVGANGKPSQTIYKVIRSNDSYSLIELKPVTGRTHQLRVHMQYIKHPIVGDFLYGGGETYSRLMLHAHKLSIYLPESTKLSTFESTMPKEFNSIINI